MVGAGFFRRSRICAKRRSIIYCDSLIGGGDEVEGLSVGADNDGDGNSGDEVGIGGISEVSDGDLESKDVS
jgi:hypothetical protein